MRADNNKIIFCNGKHLIPDKKIPLSFPYIKKLGKSMGVGDTGPVALVPGGGGRDKYRIYRGTGTGSEKQRTAAHGGSFLYGKY